MTDLLTQHMTLPYSAMAASGQVRFDRLLNLFQDAASHHCHQLGVSLFDLIPKNLKWVVSRYQLTIHAPLDWAAPYELRTWRLPWKNLYELRFFSIQDENGREMVSALGIWIMVKAHNSKPVRLGYHMPPELMADSAPEPDLWENNPEISEPDCTRRFSIRSHDLDLNRHVNNTVYATWALESLPLSFLDEVVPKTLVVSFLKESFYPDTVIASARIEKSDTTAVSSHAIVNEASGDRLANLTMSWETV